MDQDWLELTARLTDKLASHQTNLCTGKYHGHLDTAESPFPRKPTLPGFVRGVGRYCHGEMLEMTTHRRSESEQLTQG